MLNKRLIAEIINGEEIVMTIDQNMLSCEFGSLDRGSITDVVNWGIYANRGSISFIDNIGYFNNKNTSFLEVKNYTVKFYLMKSQKSLIATFKIDSVDFDEETREVNIDLVSKIISLQKERTTRSVYPFYRSVLGNLLSDIIDTIPNARISIGEDSANIKNTFIECPYIGIDTAWNVLTKICQASMSRLVEAENGDLILTSSFPKRTPIIVEPNNIINIENASFVRIENASIDVTKRDVFENSILDGSQKSFSINRDEARRFVSVDGFTVNNKRDYAEGGYYQEYIEGTLNFKTPYKIFKVEPDNDSIVNEHLQMGTLTANSAITEDKTYSRKSSLCENITVVDESYINAKIRELKVTNRFTEPESYFQDIHTNGGIFKFRVYTFIDDGKTSLFINLDKGKDVEIIQSNDLIQNRSYRGGLGQPVVPSLGEYILDEVKKRYSNGIECFEIECLFNSYYYNDGSIAYPTQDISKHFKKYDVIIPYVMKKGQRVPLRVNADGTPKKFRVIGISYSYDGLLRQKLSVQEERYDVD